MIRNNSAALPPLILLFFGVIIPLAAWKIRKLAFWGALSGTFFAFAVSILNISRVLQFGEISYRFGGWNPPIGIEYTLDPLSAFLTAVINGISFLVLIHAGKSISLEIPEHRHPPYYALIMLMLCGYNGIVMTGDFFNLYVFLEISSLALYGLIAAGDKKAPMAAFRYLIMGTVGGSFYLLGTGFLYFTTGSLNMADIRNILPELSSQPAVIVALAFMVIGFGLKMAMFPLHGWLPDAYTHAPSSASSLMAPSGIKIGAYGILRLLFFVFGVRFVTRTFPVADAVAWLSAIGIIYGSIMALAQKELKRMLAYSSISQIGYIGLGIGLANSAGLIGALLHILNHGLMKACLFLVAANFRARLGHSRIMEFNHSLRKTMPWTTAALIVGAMSMIGIPPTAGFFSKWYLAMGTIQNQSWHFLAVILLSSLLNAVYFFRILEKIYLKPLDTESEPPVDGRKSGVKEVSPSMLIPTLIFALALIVAGFLNVLIINGLLSKIIPPGGIG